MAAPETSEDPWPYGLRAATESAGSVAAPLLAGFSFTLIGLIVPEGKGIRWPGVALTLLVASGLLFVAAVQSAFWARQWTATPTDPIDWWPNDPPAQRHAELRLHKRGFDIWARRLRYTYRLGILSLLAGITIVLVPAGDISATRWIAIGTAITGTALEGGWVAAGWVLKGSPYGTYDDDPDVPEQGTSMLWIRNARVIRAVARWFIPLPRAAR